MQWVMQGLAADALRSVIRAVGYLQEAPITSRSLPRALLTANAAQGLAREVVRLRAYGDLVLPVTTHAQSAARENRLDSIGSALPHLPLLVDCLAENFGHRPEPQQRELRGVVVTADELGLRSVEEKLSRSLAPDGGDQPSCAGARRQLVGLLQAEAQAWRLMENSRLANALIVDRGFLDTYVQGRKRARECMQAQLKTPTDSAHRPGGKKKTGLKPAQLRDLVRWQRSIVVQVDMLAGSLALNSDLGSLAMAQKQALVAAERGLLLGRLARVLPEDDALIDGVNQHRVELISELQVAFAPGKANFRKLLGSQLG